MGDPILERIVNGSPALARMLADLHQRTLERQAERAQADPLAHKLTRVLPPGARGRYRYISAGRDGRGRLVWFCYATERNAAGFFLGWREVTSRNQTKRDRWLSRRLMRRVREIAERRAASYRARTDRVLPKSQEPKNA